MDEVKRQRLEQAGWRVGDAASFLELSPEEAAFVDLKLALARLLQEVRAEQDLTQLQVARRIGSSQSRVAKMEAADSTVSVDLMVKSLLKLGATRAELGEAIGSES